jgi:hypothetical protein
LRWTRALQGADEAYGPVRGAVIAESAAARNDLMKPDDGRGALMRRIRLAKAGQRLNCIYWCLGVIKKVYWERDAWDAGEFDLCLMSLLFKGRQNPLQ